MRTQTFQHPIVTLLVAASDAVCAAKERFATWRHRRRTAVDIRTLDDAALRDIGMSRSEIGSYEAEAAGRAERTRLRILARYEMTSLK